MKKILRHAFAFFALAAIGCSAAGPEGGGTTDEVVTAPSPSDGTSTPDMLPINHTNGDPGTTSAACLGCLHSCVTSGQSSKQCATECTSLCHPADLSSLNGKYTSFAGPCEIAWKDCILKAGINVFAEAECYAEWVYCKATTKN